MYYSLLGEGFVNMVKGLVWTSKVTYEIQIAFEGTYGRSSVGRNELYRSWLVS